MHEQNHKTSRSDLWENVWCFLQNIDWFGWCFPMSETYHRLLLNQFIAIRLTTTKKTGWKNMCKSIGLRFEIPKRNRLAKHRPFGWKRKKEKKRKKRKKYEKSKNREQNIQNFQISVIQNHQSLDKHTR